jgi:hypothetical protein
MTEDEARAAGLTIKTEDEMLLDELADSEGMDIDEMMENAILDGTSPGICREGCGYTTQIEPDSETGWCEFCGTNTVVSAAVLAGIL